MNTYNYDLAVFRSRAKCESSVCLWQQLLKYSAQATEDVTVMVANYGPVSVMYLPGYAAYRCTGITTSEAEWIIDSDFAAAILHDMTLYSD